MNPRVLAVRAAAVLPTCLLMAGVPAVGAAQASPGASASALASTRATASPSASGPWQRAGCDVDGDGFEDLAVTGLVRTVTSEESYRDGVVTVLYGSASGTSASRSQIWRPLTTDAPRLFGAALACGDVDGNGYDDLVVGLHGGISVIRGGPQGLTPQGRTEFGGEAAGLGPEPERPGPGDLGTPLSVADFDGDGYDDVVSASDYGVGQQEGGVVVLFRGSATGIDPHRRTFLSQDTSGVPGSSESGDGFGDALAAGDVTGDGIADLAVAAPGETIGTAPPAAGAVWVFPGSHAGLVPSKGWLVHQDTPGVPGHGESDDRFGSALAMGDVDGDGRADLAVGVPWEDEEGRSGAVRRSGAVVVLRTAGSRLGSAATRFTQSAKGVPGTPQANDQCGTELVVGDADGDRYADLATACPLESVSAPGDGVVLVTPGGGSGPAVGRTRSWHADTPGLPRFPVRGLLLGWALTFRDGNGDGVDDLIVGSAGDHPVGVLQVPGGSSGLTATGSRIWVPGRDGVPMDDEPWAPFGYELSRSG